MEQLKVSLPSLLNKPMQESVSDHDRQAYASLKAGQMFGCYRKQDANDPQIYVAAVTATLSEYSNEVMDFVTDPRTGLPSRLKWLPTVAEVREACEVRKEIQDNFDRGRQLALKNLAIVDDPNIDERFKRMPREWLEKFGAKYL